MNVQHILELIRQEDPEVYERLDTRRAVMRRFTRLSGKLAAAAVPAMVGSMLNKAYGQTPGTALQDILNFALTLEYLEAEFYATALAAPGLIPDAAARAAIQTIANHEAAHVKFIAGALTSAGGTPIAKPTFDFSANGGGNVPGPLANVFTDYDLFLAVAQVLEDTGVRAYKGQAGNLTGGGAVLQAALQIHSVEARHAAHIRQMRRARGANVKPWITGDDSGIANPPALAVSAYAGEGTTVQAGIELSNLRLPGILSPNEKPTVTQSAQVTESFDEPLTREQVGFLVAPFIVK
jgi:hypothetical protein